MHIGHIVIYYRGGRAGGMGKVMWNKLREQAQLGTNNAEGREPGEEVMQNPGLPSLLGHLLILSGN